MPSQISPAARKNKSARPTLALPAATLLALLLAPVFPASAQQTDSAYTSIDLEKCHRITRAELGLPEQSEEEAGTDGGQWLCVGYDNSIVYVAEGDLRQFVSYGSNAMQEMAARQTLPAFNRVGDTIEWRLRKVNGQWVPFATILRWHTESGDAAQDRGQVLVVTRLEPGNTCHVAYVDALLTPDANQVARDIADAEAEKFNCASDDILAVPS